MSVAGKHILLIITGGIAAFKALELIRLIQKQGGTVQAILTEAATKFVTPLSVATLSGNKAFTALFDLTREAEIGHIELSRSADLIVVAPASADFLAKMAQGIANDLASTTILATDTDVMVAPAMNVRMWQAAATQRNVELLRQDGVAFIGPDDGEMACGEFGPGRMAEPEDIVTQMDTYFAGTGAKPLAGKRVIVTSGPTREWLDPVRYISNASSGKQGTAIAEALAKLGADVQFVTGPAEHAGPVGCSIFPVQSARDMQAAVQNCLPADVAIFCAAVADWGVAEAAPEKIKKTNDKTPPEFSLVANPDILAEVAQMAVGGRPELVIGFAAETENLLENAKAKRARKGCDWLLANDVGTDTDTFGSDNNRIYFLDGDAPNDWGAMSKVGIGEKLAARVAAHFDHSN